MQSYTRQASIGTYIVDKALLENIEYFLHNDILRILNVVSDNSDNWDVVAKQFKECISIKLSDSHGEELLHSIKDYRYPFFNNDIDAISIELDMGGNMQGRDLNIKIRFAHTNKGTDMSVFLSDVNAREKVHAIESGLRNVMETNRSFNWILWQNMRG